MIQRMVQEIKSVCYKKVVFHKIMKEPVMAIRLLAEKQSQPAEGMLARQRCPYDFAPFHSARNDVIQE